MKKITVLSLAFLVVIGATSCKPKQSAYRQAYEQAKQREVVAVEDTREISKTPSREVVVRQERVSVVEGEDATGLKQFCVVIGSFQNMANATSLKERMVENGFRPVLVQNEQGMMRVIVSSFSTREEAAASRDAIKERFAPNFQDAWLLQREG